MNKLSSVSLILRVSFSVLMLTHGWRKFLKIIEGDWGFANPIGFGEEISLFLAVFAEFICSVLLIIGFKSRWTAIPPAITMLIAAFIIHANDPFGKQELPLLYFLGYLCIIILGSGQYSLDAVLKRK